MNELFNRECTVQGKPDRTDPELAHLNQTKDML